MDLAHFANSSVRPAATPRTPLTPLFLCATGAAIVLCFGALAGLRADSLLVAPISLALLGVVLAVRRWDERRQLRAAADAWIERGYESPASRYGWRIDELTSRARAPDARAARCATSSRSSPSGGCPARRRSTASRCGRTARELIALADRLDDLDAPGLGRRDPRASTTCSPSRTAFSTPRPLRRAAAATSAPSSSPFSTAWRCVADVRPRRDRYRARLLRLHLPAPLGPGARLMSARRRDRARHLAARARLPRLRALPRGEVLDDGPGHRPDRRLRRRPRRARVPARALHGAGVHGAAVRRPPARRDRARLLPDRRHRPGPRAGLEELREDGSRLQRLLLPRPLRDPAPPGAPVPQPEPLQGGARASLAQHRRELRHEHELAVLRRRVDDVVLHADGRARGAAVRLGRRRDGRARRRHPRDRAPLVRHARQLLGRPLPVARLHLPAALADPRLRPPHAGRSADVRGHRQRAHARGSDAADRARAGRAACSRSSSSGRTAAASTTRTPPSRSRTRTGSRTSSR